MYILIPSSQAIAVEGDALQGLHFCQCYYRQGWVKNVQIAVRCPCQDVLLEGCLPI